MKKIISIVLKFLIIVLSFIGLRLCFYSLKSFTYFTILSNIFVFITTLIFFIKNFIEIIIRKKVNFHSFLYVLRFFSTISIFLTFFVFLLILAPIYPDGFIAAYKMDNYGSVFVHMIVPVLSIIDFLFFDNDFKYGKKHVFLSTVPPLSYLFFIIIIGQLGLRWDGMYAPYNFLNYMSPIGWFGFDLSIIEVQTFGIGTFYMIIILLIIFILVGKLFVFLNNKKR